MANTCGSAGRTTVRNRGSEKVNQTPSQNPTVNLKEETTHHSDQPTTAEKPRRRGRPKAMATTNMVIDNSDQAPASMERQPRKRVRKDTLLPTSELVSQPASKRAKTNDTGNDQPVNHQGKATGKRKAANVAPPIRSPLPERIGRNIHPAPKKGTRRTPQEVQAEREAHKKAIEEKIRELEEAKRLLAEANAAEDIEDDARTILSVSPLQSTNASTLILRVIVTVERPSTSGMLMRCRTHLRAKNLQNKKL